MSWQKKKTISESKEAALHKPTNTTVATVSTGDSRSWRWYKKNLAGGCRWCVCGGVMLKIKLPHMTSESLKSPNTCPRSYVFSDLLLIFYWVLFDTQPILPKSQQVIKIKPFMKKQHTVQLITKINIYIYIYVCTDTHTYIYIHIYENTKMNKQMNQQMKYFALFCSFQLCWGCKNEPAMLSSPGKHASVVFRWSPSGAGPICSCSPAACHRALNLKHSALSKKRRPPATANMSQPKPTRKKTQSTCIAKKTLLLGYHFLLMLHCLTYDNTHSMMGMFLANELHLLSCWSVKPRQGSSVSMGVNWTGGSRLCHLRLEEMVVVILVARWFIRGGCKIIRAIGALDEVAKTPISQIISVVRCPIIFGKTLYHKRQIHRNFYLFKIWTKTKNVSKLFVSKLKAFLSFQNFTGPNHRKQKQHCLSRSSWTPFRSSPCKSLTGLLQFQQSFCGNKAAKPWRYIFHLTKKTYPILFLQFDTFWSSPRNCSSKSMGFNRSPVLDAFWRS